MVDSQHDERISSLPSLKGNEEQHECQKSGKGCYEWDNSCGLECYWVIVPMMQIEVWVLQSQEWRS